MIAGDELALGVMDGLKSVGLRVPDDILVTGFDGLPQPSWAGYDRTTLVQPTDALVARAIDFLLEPRELQPQDYTPSTSRIGRTTTRSAATRTARTAANRPDHKDDTSHA